MTRAEDLAATFEKTNDEVIAAVGACSDAQWRTTTQAERWPAAVVAHHIAIDHELIAGLAQTIATGGTPPPLDMAALDQMNAEHAQKFANCTKAETLQILRDGGAKASATIRSLSDEQLDRTANLALMGGQPVSAQQAIENILIGHPQGHLQSFRAATGQE